MQWNCNEDYRRKYLKHIIALLGTKEVGKVLIITQNVASQEWRLFSEKKRKEFGP